MSWNGSASYLSHCNPACHAAPHHGRTEQRASKCPPSVSDSIVAPPYKTSSAVYHNPQHESSLSRQERKRRLRRTNSQDQLHNFYLTTVEQNKTQERPDKQTCMSNHLQPLLVLLGSHVNYRVSPKTCLFLQSVILQHTLTPGHPAALPVGFSPVFTGSEELRLQTQVTRLFFALSVILQWKQSFKKTEWRHAEDRVSSDVTQQVIKHLQEVFVFYWKPLLIS